MKRLLALAALALAASACTTTTDNTNTGAGNTNANANANSNAAAAATPAAPEVTQADLEARERQVWDALKAKNWEAFAGTMSDDFVIVGPRGVSGKTQLLEEVKRYELAEYTLSDFRLVRVDADLAVITYTTRERGTFDGKPLPDRPVRASSAWVNRGGRWVAAYHQETEVVEPTGPEPTPAPSPAASPSPSASPAASPAAAPASATDAEKALWAAIQGRNYDAFANFLLPESLEVEPEGVFDKPTAVRMVGLFDASKFRQGDFKETRLDADATLLTYTVTGPVAGRNVTEYHSTIWTNRGGQWRAAFHQGSRPPAKQ
jgi:hypothetical protein